MSPLPAPRIGGLILSAGASRRMGRPKALLPLEGATFLEVLLDRFARAGVSPIVVVLGADAEEVRSAVKLTLPRIAINPDPARGQLSSVHCGLDAFTPGELDALFLAPVDAPRVRVETLQRMIAALPGRRLVIPVYQGRRGHPALFSASLFPALRTASPQVGARAVVHATSDRLELPVDDPAVVEDVDDPADRPG